jgi:hypothetical protein
MISEFAHVLSGRWARLVLATVFLEGVFLYGAFAFIATHVHLVHGIPLSRAGLLVMLFGFGGLLFATGSAVLVRRLGETGLTRWGGAIAAAGLLVTGLAPRWGWAIPGCFITGLGFYMLHAFCKSTPPKWRPNGVGRPCRPLLPAFFLGQSLGIDLAGIVADRMGTATVLVLGSAGLLLISLDFSRL